MLFNSLAFLVFLPVVTLLYFTCPVRGRWIVLLAASYFFYGYWKAEYLGLLAASSLIDFYCGREMAKRPLGRPRRPFLLASLFSNLGMLFAFKYFDFFARSTHNAAQALGLALDVPQLQWVLPVGISFYTFQTLSYSIDVYYDRIPAARHLGLFAVFVAFFPQLVAGPIERASHLLPQFSAPRTFSSRRLFEGLELVFFGLAKKLVLADRLAIFVNGAYDSPHQHGGLTLGLATVFFAFQIYCDFSAYSDIAIGTARIFGFDLMQNFNHPYNAHNIPEFWHRWHISLSTWFRDYVYIPLGGNRVSTWRWYLNMFLTFLVSGLWHGANWTFVAWGAMHGVLIVIHNLGGRLRFMQEGLAWRLRQGPLAVLTTFVVVNLSWVLFRANDIHDAAFILGTMLEPSTYSPTELRHFVANLQNFSFLDLFIAGGSVVILYVAGIFRAAQRFREWEAGWRTGVKPVAYALGIVGILLLGVFNDESQFIYFQF